MALTQILKKEKRYRQLFHLLYMCAGKLSEANLKIQCVGFSGI